MSEKYKQLEDKIGIKFSNAELLERAFTHKSYLNENRDPKLKDNERLEFLGDAVLELAATHHLFDKYPEKNEGHMTSLRSALVKGANLAIIAENLELGQYLYLSKGEEKSGGRQKKYILANVTEALIGAIYLEHGYEVTEKFIDQFILADLKNILAEGLHIDSKSQFQEIAQAKVATTPHYQLISEEGPDHNKQFVMGAYLGEELVAKGQGTSKQKAEENAAHNALNQKGWI